VLGYVVWMQAQKVDYYHWPMIIMVIKVLNIIDARCNHEVQLLCFGHLYLPTDTHNKIQWQITVIKNGDLSLKYAWGFMFGVTCNVCLCWHILIVVSTVHRRSNIKFAAFQLWRCPFTAFWRFKSSGKDSASLGEWFAVVQESSIPRWLLDSHDGGAILRQNMGNYSPSVTSTKNLIFSNTAVRNSDLTLQCFLIFKIPQILVW